MVAAQPFVGAQQPAHVRRHPVERRRLPFHHVGVEIGRPPHRLARVVDDEVEARAGGEQVTAERFDAGRVAQVEAEDLQPVAPVGKIRFARVARGGIARKARRHDQLRTAAQQLEPRLVPDLHAAARQQRNTTAQVSDLSALAEIELRACGAQLVVEVMDLDVLFLADIAVLQLLGVGAVSPELLRSGGRTARAEIRWACGRPAFAAASGSLFPARDLIALHARGFALARRDLRHATPLDAVGMIDRRHRLEQSLAFVIRDAFEHRPIRRDRFEQLNRFAQPIHKPSHAISVLRPHRRR